MQEPYNLPISVQPWIRHLVGSLLDKNPDKRPTTEQILQIPEINIQIEKMVDLVFQEDSMLGLSIMKTLNWPIPFEGTKCSLREEDVAYFIRSFKNKRIQTIPLFRGSEHGWTAKDFHSRCDDKGATFTIIQGPVGGSLGCVGGYT